MIPVLVFLTYLHVHTRAVERMAHSQFLASCQTLEWNLSVQERLQNINFLKLLLACQLVNEPCKLSQICTHMTRYLHCTAHV